MQLEPCESILCKQDPQERDSKVKTWGQVITFTAYSLNVLLGTLEVDAEPLKLINIEPPYVDIQHLVCENHSMAKECIIHLTFPYSQMNMEA